MQHYTTRKHQSCQHTARDAPLFVPLRSSAHRLSITRRAAPRRTHAKTVEYQPVHARLNVPSISSAMLALFNGVTTSLPVHSSPRYSV
jgi:hypothetical protein